MKTVIPVVTPEQMIEIGKGKKVKERDKNENKEKPEESFKPRRKVEVDDV